MGKKTALSKMCQERWPTSCGTTAHPIKEKCLNMKAMTTYKRPATIGKKLTNYKHLALTKTNKQTKGLPGLGNTVHFVVET